MLGCFVSGQGCKVSTALRVYGLGLGLYMAPDLKILGLRSTGAWSLMLRIILYFVP